MELETSYSENLPSPNFKTRKFGRLIRRTLPDGADKETVLKEAEKQQAMCEALVKNDIARHIEKMEASE